MLVLKLNVNSPSESSLTPVPQMLLFKYFQCLLSVCLILFSLAHTHYVYHIYSATFWGHSPCFLIALILLPNTALLRPLLWLLLSGMLVAFQVLIVYERIYVGCDKREHGAAISQTALEQSELRESTAQRRNKEPPEFTGFASNFNEILAMLARLLGLHTALHSYTISISPKSTKLLGHWNGGPTEEVVVDGKRIAKEAEPRYGLGWRHWLCQLIPFDFSMSGKDKKSFRNFFFWGGGVGRGEEISLQFKMNHCLEMMLVKIFQNLIL